MAEERYTLDGMISVEEAQSIILAHAGLLPEETVGIDECEGRVLAADVAADSDIAPFANSAMDGFALRYADIVDVPDAPALPIVGVLAAGMVFEGELPPKSALRIMTGAPVPKGADTVVKIEDCQVSGLTDDNKTGTEVQVTVPQEFGLHIRQAGEEAKKGDVLMRTGDVITAAGVGLLASTGNAVVRVYARPKVAVFSTGSELVDVSETPGPGQIRNSNSHSLAAQARLAGAVVTILPAVEDTVEAYAAAIQGAVATHDVVVLSGGAAEGDFDFTSKTVRMLGTILFNKVAMRPGKAQTFGIIDDTMVVGLPGNPAAAAVGFEMLVRPALRQMQGFRQLYRPVTVARLTKEVRKKEPRRYYLRASLQRDAETDAGPGPANGPAHGLGSRFTVTPAENQSSALYRTLYEGNCLLVIPEGASLKVGDEAECLRLDLPEGALI